MSTDPGPIGMSVSQSVELRLKSSTRYREAYERLAPFERIARIVIRRRGELGLSEQELAARMGTTTAVISRIERGQHRTGTETLRRLAEALDGHALFGSESPTEVKPTREPGAP